MCGFITAISKTSQPIEKEEVLRAADLMNYRGPDYTGVLSDKESKSVFVHKRLSIIDTSPAGHQPMVSEAGNILVYNGEIYNFRELRFQLEEMGVVFRGESDSEVLLRAFEHWGVDVLNKLEGMYSFVIFIKAEQRFLCATDRFGIKPLYYCETNDHLYFSSAVMPIAKLIKTVTIDTQKYFNFSYLGWDSDEQLLIKEISRAPIGSYAFVENGKLRAFKKYYSLDQAWISTPKAKPDLDAVIGHSVKATMVSDVPIGLFLSGGVDSSLVAAKMQQFSDKKIKTFSMRFEDASIDESQYSRGVANYLKTEHNEINISNKELVDSTLFFLENMDYPVADPAALPLYHLAKVASNQVKVSLCGDGGDELFRGYSLYNLPRGTETLFKQNPQIKKLLHACLQIAPSNKAKTLQKFLSAKSVAELYFMLRQNNRQSDQVIPSHCPEASAQRGNISLEQALNLLDLEHYLPSCLLPKTDFASMLPSIEARVPLLNHSVLEASLQLEYSAKKNKAHLKELLKTYIPQDIWDHSKHGFEVPVASWLQNELADLIVDVENCPLTNSLESQLPLISQFKQQPIKFENKMWTSIVLQKWLKQLSTICRVKVS